ncbi:MAG TPA: DUF5658 family protein [Acidimicrobiia bacterium]|nr:DUF5658 family protein [Acidimicrobiia bacterium]
MSTSVEAGAQPGQPRLPWRGPAGRRADAARTYDAMVAKLSWWSLRILLIAAVLDALTTYVSLQSAHARESNPLGRSLIAELGLGGAMVVRVLIGVVYFVFLKWILDTQTHRAVRFAACVVALETAAWWWIVVVNNVVVISR